MAEGSYIHLPDARADLRAKLADIERREKDVDAEAKPIRDAYAAAIDPFIEREHALEEERELLLQKHDTEVVAHCEGCSTLILEGDRYSWGSEDGIYLCVECSPTWEEALESMKHDPEDWAEGIAHAEAMIAAGRGKEKVV